MDWFEYDDLPTTLKYIAIHDCVSGNYFIRKLTDISFYDNRVIFPGKIQIGLSSVSDRSYILDYSFHIEVITW